MLKREELDGIVVVLVRARNPSNIGAVARAMHDFGFRHLRVVNEYAVPFEAAKSAVDAGAVLAAAASFDSVAEAVADCTLVMGTTAVGERVLQHPLRVLPAAAEEMLAHLARRSGGEAGGEFGGDAARGRVALLFGSEKTGLSNEELSHCSCLLTIPMAEQEELRHPSMNLGQAVAVCLYEVVRQAEFAGGRPLDPAWLRGPAAAEAAEVERVALLLNEVLERAEYRRHHPANSEAEDVRRLVVRMGLTATDAPVWMGMLRQFIWRLSKP